MSEPLQNGHDKSEATLAEACDLAGGTMSTGSMAVAYQIRALQISAERRAERATIEALSKDAVQRLAEAYQAGNWQRAAEITRELCRLEVYLSRRGFDW
jgi:hypothetical protein